MTFRVTFAGVVLIAGVLGITSLITGLPGCTSSSDGSAGGGGSDGGGPSTDAATEASAAAADASPMGTCASTCEKQIGKGCSGTKYDQATCETACRNQAASCSTPDAGKGAAYQAYLDCIEATPVTCTAIGQLASSEDCTNQGLVVAGCASCYLTPETDEKCAANHPDKPKGWTCGPVGLPVDCVELETGANRPNYCCPRPPM